MAWQQLHLQLKSTEIDAISDALHELGAVAVTMMDAEDKPIFEPPLGTTPLWDLTQLTGLFDISRDLDTVLAELAARFGNAIIVQARQEQLPEQDWERTWMNDFKPMLFGNHLWIVPSWHDAPNPDGANIQLDPGLAFGTGTHPTTALCLEWLDTHPPKDKQVIDYGCGSGILAIAALKLGAEQVIGIDTDPQALLASGDNAIKNRVDDRLELFLPEAMPALQCDLLLANILANPLTELAEKIAHLVKSGGQIVLSGILKEQAEELQQIYTQWFDMAPIVHKEDWVRLEGVKK